MIDKTKLTIGIAGAGLQGRHIAFWTACHRIRTILYDIHQDQINDVNRELAGRKKKKKIILEHLSMTTQLSDLTGCDLIIENVFEDLNVKLALFRELETVLAGSNTILSSNSSTLLPGQLARQLTRPGQFINIHFLGIPFGMLIVELVPSAQTRPEVTELCRRILTTTGLSVIITGECPGFVYNRIKLAELSTAFRAIEMGLVSLENGLKYILFPQMTAPISFIDFLGLDVEYAAINYLQAAYGSRFYRSTILEQKVAAKECGRKHGRGLLDHTHPIDPDSLCYGRQLSHQASSIKTIWFQELQISNLNLLLKLKNLGKEIWMNKQQTRTFWIQLTGLNPRLAASLQEYCHFSPQESRRPAEVHFDLIIDIPPFLTEKALQKRLAAMTAEEQADIPVLVNLPCYCLARIRENLAQSHLIFGMNVMRSYLTNFELIIPENHDSPHYQLLKDLARELAGQVIEVNDHELRPLTLMQIIKMCEIIMVLEEKIVSLEDLEKILITTDTSSSDIDYLGLDRLLEYFKHMQQHCGLEMGEVEKIIQKRLDQGKQGTTSGRGYHNYEKSAAGRQPE